MNSDDCLPKFQKSTNVNFMRQPILSNRLYNALNITKHDCKKVKALFTIHKKQKWQTQTNDN